MSLRYNVLLRNRGYPEFNAQAAIWYYERRFKTPIYSLRSNWLEHNFSSCI